ncbi:MAG: hypothetical protein AMXMBFR4_00820 [Candidatus Hydrogenedentota bacterium]
MRTCILLALCLTVIPFAFGQDPPKNPERDNIETYRIFGPEHPGVYKHPAALTELDNGDLYLAYYGGLGEYDEDTAVYGSRLKKGDTQWTFPEIIADTPDIGDGNPVVWQGPDGRVWLFYNCRYGESKTWSDGRVLGKVSKDGAQTWSDSFVVNFEAGSMVRGRPEALSNGDYLLPFYHETGHDPERTAPDTASYFMRYDPKTKKWSETERIVSPNGNLQPQIAELEPGHVVAYCRRGGGFGREERGYIIRSESKDYGQTWTPGVDTEFPNPNSAVDFLKLKNGHLLLVYNDSYNERTPLTVAISTDNDKTYPYRRHILGGQNTYAYPYAIQTKDEKIHIICTTNSRTTILHSVFNETAITESPWINE